MKLHGTKLILASAIALTTNMAQAENPHPLQLTTFKANTPAKATEVNANFTNLRKYSTDLNQVVTAQAALIEALEEKVTALESTNTTLENEFTIEVKGDGEVIGYTNEVIATFNDPIVILKTAYGITSIKGGYGDNKYILKQYDPIYKDDIDSFYVKYSDANCQNPINVINSGDGNPALFTTVANTLDSNLLFIGETDVYTAVKGTIFNSNATNVYELNAETCSKAEWFTGGAVLPVTKVTTLKNVYNTIEIDGYVSN